MSCLKWSPKWSESTFVVYLMTAWSRAIVIYDLLVEMGLPCSTLRSWAFCWYLHLLLWHFSLLVCQCPFTIQSRCSLCPSFSVHAFHCCILTVWALPETQYSLSSTTMHMAMTFQSIFPVRVSLLRARLLISTTSLPGKICICRNRYCKLCLQNQT